MGMKSILRAGNSMVKMAKKSFVFFTLALSLSIMDKAYSTYTCLHIYNDIAPNQVFYSKKGYKFEPIGKGACMYNVTPSSYIATYTHYVHLSIHYKSSGICALKDSTQNFNVINNDTGKVVGKFTWIKPMGRMFHSYLEITNNPGFMEDRAEYDYIKFNSLNLWLNKEEKPC